MLQRLWEWAGQWFRPCNFSAYRYFRKLFAPDLSAWLAQHPNVAAAIQWQHQVADPANAYAAPTAAHKLAWAGWSASEKAELDDAYREAYVWLECGARQIAMDPAGPTDVPVNVHPNAADDTITAVQNVSAAYMRKLYVAHVAFTLAAEIIGEFPWRITTYGSGALRCLLDSATMAWRHPGDRYGMGTYALRVPAERADNRPRTAFAPPTWTYPWLRQAGLVGGSSRETILRLLEWMRRNLVHFYGADTMGRFNAVWQYRGYPPLSRIITGTVDADHAGEGLRRWTAGCHGSVGFLCAVLRAANIPVQPVWICGHAAAHFIADDLYLDHGDDPYNQNVLRSRSPIDALLIDSATYRAWFTSDLKANVTGTAGAACANVGRAAREFV